MDLVRKLPLEYLPVISLTSLFIVFFLLEKFQAVYGKKSNNSSQSLNGYKIALEELSKRVSSVEENLRSEVQSLHDDIQKLSAKLEQMMVLMQNIIVRRGEGG